MKNQPIIIVDAIQKKYRNSAEFSVDQVSFEIIKGEKFGLFGPNGAGKTTLISMMCGIIEQTSGEVHYFLEGTEQPIAKVLTKIGFVPQDFALYPELSARQNLSYFGSLYEIPKNELNSRINFLLETLGLVHVADKKVATFSGGMKRRVNLAIGIINNPEVLFLDEPTVGVDVQSKMAIIKYLDYLNELGMTIIYTSHHMKEAEEFCDRIALIDHGKLIALDHLEGIKTKYEVEDLESFFIKLTGLAYRD